MRGALWGKKREFNRKGRKGKTRSAQRDMSSSRSLRYLFEFGARRPPMVSERLLKINREKGKVRQASGQEDSQAEAV
jgi:hypothetical protein